MILMRPYTLGIDTSCYTTSLAIADENGNLVCEKRQMLNVKKGARGLRQSEGFFQHVMNLPTLLEQIAKDVDMNQIGCIAVSTRPRNQEGSYMPVFSAGERFAKSLALALKVPMFTTTHQDGHIMASAYSCDFDHMKEHISVHLSGGTSEILKSSWKDHCFDIDIIGGTLDVSAGQLIDRVGVALGLDFPCGKHLDQIWQKSSKKLKFPVSVKGTEFNFSGAESYGLKYIESGESPSDISMGLFESVCKTLEKSLLKASEETGVKSILMSGGVSSSVFLSSKLPETLMKKGVSVYFCEPKFAADNAIGVAILGAKSRQVSRGELNET